MSKKQPKILVIDDEPALLNILRIKLEQAGYRGFGALSGKDGLVIAKKEKPDLILLDILMPEMDGFEVLRRLKKMPGARKGRVVILSNSGRDDDIKKGRNLGAEDYLVKTRFTLEEMMQTVKNCLRGKCSAG